MKKISLVVNKPFLNNNIFQQENKYLNRDNFLKQYIELRSTLLKKNIDLSTFDINKIEDSQIIIFLNAPKGNNKLYNQSVLQNKIIYIIENEHYDIHKANRDIKKLTHVKRIFSYRSKYYSNAIKLNFSFDFPNQISANFLERKKLVCMIANNKLYNIKNELYTKRKEVINWFEKNNINDFNLYGGGWQYEVYSSKNLMNKFLNRLKLKKLKKLKSYKGRIENKKEALTSHKFSICFENSIEDGWITEKIFDSLLNGCIPIYYGTPDIEKIISKKCFIDYKEFNTIDKLYNYIKNMKEQEYNSYIKNIQSFILKQSLYNQFTIQYFVDTIIEKIIFDLNESC